MNKTDMVEGAENGRCAKQPMRCEHNCPCDLIEIFLAGRAMQAHGVFPVRFFDARRGRDRDRKTHLTQSAK